MADATTAAASATGRLWGRLARLTVALPSGSFSDTDPALNAIIIDASDSAGATGLRISFEIVKTRGKQPNTSEITLYNLAPHTRAAIAARGKGARMLLETGYVATGLAQTAIGDVRTVDHVRDGADWKTVLKCGDGERAMRFARASESFAGGTTVAAVVNYCAAQMGLSLGNTSAQAAKLSTALAHGWVVHGAASTELDRVLRAVGYRYSVQEGQIQILAPGEGVAQTVPDLTPDTGLVGSPEAGTPEKKGGPASIKAKALLMPAARCGGRVHVKSERYDGIYQIRKIAHAGDTHGDDWYTSLVLVADPTAQVA